MADWWHGAALMSLFISIVTACQQQQQYKFLSDSYLASSQLQKPGTLNCCSVLDQPSDQLSHLQLEMGVVILLNLDNNSGPAPADEHAVWCTETPASKRRELMRKWKLKKWESAIQTQADVMILMWTCSHVPLTQGNIYIEINVIILLSFQCTTAVASRCFIFWGEELMSIAWQWWRQSSPYSLQWKWHFTVRLVVISITLSVCFMWNREISNSLSAS